MKLFKPLQNAQKPTLQNSRNKEGLVGILFILPSLIGVGIFILIPFLDVIKRSFFGAMTGKFVGMDNYKKVFENEAFKLAATNTLEFISICIPLLIVLSLGVAVLVNTTPFGEVFKTTFLIPLAVPVASVVLIWDVLFHQNGMLSRWMVQQGGTPVDWMNTGWSFWILVGSYIWRNLGYNMVLWLAGLNNIGEAVYEAASMDGANRRQTFAYITLPLLMPTLYIISVLSLLNAFKVFREAYLIAGDYPNDQIYMMQHLFNNWFIGLEMDKLSAGAVIVSICVLILIVLLQKVWGREDEDD